jgi:predicted PurR-regulated permease PerM
VTTEDLPTRDPDQDKLEGVATVAFVIIFIAAIVGVSFVLFHFLTDFILALLFLSLFSPLYRWLLPRLKWRKWLASLIVSLVVVIVVAIPTTFVVGSLSAEAANLYDATRDSLSLERVDQFLFGDGILATYAKKLAALAGIEYTHESVRESASNVAGTVTAFLYNQIQTVLQNVFSVVFHFLIMIVMLFYLFMDGARLKSYVFLLSPLPPEEEELIANQFKNVGRATLFGNGIGSLIQGTIAGIAMAVVGLPSPVLWGSVASIFAFLPLIGIGIVTVPSTIYLIAVERYWTAAIFFGFCTTASLLVENVLKTKLIGDQMKMHNLLIFLSILGGIATFSIIGILYGPLLVMLFLTIVELYQRNYKHRLSAVLRPKSIVSLPLDRGGRLGRDVVNDAVDAPDLVDDAARDSAEHVVR